MTILTVDKKEFEKGSLGNGKIYKLSKLFSINIFPSDPTGSLDELFSRRIYA